MADTKLDDLINQAFTSEGKPEDANKVYLALLQTELFIPIDSISEASTVESHPSLTITHETEETIQPLFVVEADQIYVAAFDTFERLQQWAGDFFDDMDYVSMLGGDFIAGLSDQVHLSLNIGSEYYKEFDPDELKRLKTIVARIEALKSSADAD